MDIEPRDGPRMRRSRAMSRCIRALVAARCRRAALVAQRARRRRHEQGDPRRVPGRRDRLRSRRGARPVLGDGRAGDLRDALHLRLPRAAGEDRAADRRRRCRRSPTTARRTRSSSRRASCFTPRSGVQGQEARARRRRLSSTRSSASIDPKIRSPWAFLVEGKIVGLDELADAGEEDRASSTTTRRSPGLEAVDRYTLRFRLKDTDYNLPYVLAHEPTVGGRARGDRGVRRVATAA